MIDIQETLLRMFPNGGYFVEAGAHDGVGDSQTVRLEREGGWSGICVEPSSAFVGLQTSRTCNLDNRCLWDVSGIEVPFMEIKGNNIELSGVVSCFNDDHDRNSLSGIIHNVKSVTLTDLLKEKKAPPIIQFLSLDTEGSELRIIAAHDFSQFRFQVIQVEYAANQRRRDALLCLLGLEEYSLYHDDGYNLFLFHKDVRCSPYQ
jgi:FkbM family methyltransferase